MQGTILSNRYLVAEELGVGGMGCVYRAVDLRTGGAVAVKVPHTYLARNAEFVQRLRREAEIAASLHSTRVVRVVDLDVHEGTPYLVMEYVPGETLADVLHRRGRLGADEALAVALEVARALEAAHARGIVHRDLKPQNIKLVDGEVKVLDLGIARADGLQAMTAANTFMGTPEYAAPELLERGADIRSDIYSLGVLLYEMLAGRLPFTGPTPVAVLRHHQTEPPPPLDGGAPAWARTVVARCLAKQPEDRYQTPRELVLALRAAQESATGGPAPSGATNDRTAGAGHDGAPSPPVAPTLPAATPPAAVPSRRRRAWAWALVPVVLLALGAGGLALARAGDGDDRDDTAVGQSVAVTPTTTQPPPPPPTSTPTAPTAPPLLAPGEQRPLAALPPMALPLDPVKCPGVEVVWRLVSIAAEPAGRVAVAYTVQVPRASGVADCRVSIRPDKDCRCWALQTRLASGRVSEAPIAGGRGVADTGADDIYGRDPLPGAWIFDGVDLAGSELTLLFFGDDGVLLHRQPLLAR